MDLEEELQKIAVADLRRVEDDLDPFGMSAVVAIGSVGDVPAGIPNVGFQDAGAFPDQVLHAPETSSSQNGAFGRH